VKKQLGVSLSGLVMVLIALAIVALLAFKLIGPYQQYYTIQKTFKELAANPEVRNGGMGDLKIAWSKYAMIEHIDVTGPEDWDIVREGGNIVISAAYTVRVPLFKNISLMIDFAPTSATK